MIWFTFFFFCFFWEGLWCSERCIGRLRYTLFSNGSVWWNVFWGQPCITWPNYTVWQQWHSNLKARWKGAVLHCPTVKKRRFPLKFPLKSTTLLKILESLCWNFEFLCWWAKRGTLCRVCTTKKVVLQICLWWHLAPGSWQHFISVPLETCRFSTGCPV